MITQEFLKSIFDYKDGNLIWKRSSMTAKVGDVAGGIGQNGYVYVGINNKKYLAHRLIFLMHHGYLPKVIDHIDVNPSNNKICNLREATTVQNSHNSKIKKNNTSGHKGVSYEKRRKHWVAYINLGKKHKYLGSFKTKESAAAAYADEAKNIFKEFARAS